MALRGILSRLPESLVSRASSQAGMAALLQLSGRFSTESASGVPVKAILSDSYEALQNNKLTETTSTCTVLIEQVFNPEGEKRVVVTKELPGQRWLDILTKSGCRVEISQHEDTILNNATIKKLIGDKCHGVLGQLTEDWSEELFGALKEAGGTAYSNYAVGYNNVKVEAGTKNGIAVGNTPGVLTETTAELALALTFAAARRVVEGDKFVRANLYKGWLPTLFVGNLLQNKTVGIIGAGRIGAAYARMLSEGHKMDIVYFDPYPNKFLEEYIRDYGKLLESKGERPVTIKKLDTVEEVLKAADVVSLHCNLDEKTRHLINEDRLNMMKKDALLINASRGPVVDEVALVNHLQANPDFRCGLDVFEDEPDTKPGLTDCENAVIVPHIASASFWTRAGMATLAAQNVAAHLQGFPVWTKPDVLAFVDGPFEDIPKAAASIVNAKDLGLSEYSG